MPHGPPEAPSPHRPLVGGSGRGSGGRLWSTISLPCHGARAGASAGPPQAVHGPGGPQDAWNNMTDAERDGAQVLTGDMENMDI